MKEYILFWFSKDLVSFLIVLSIITLCILIRIIVSFVMKVKQSRCKHHSWHEDRSCHVICNDCNKDVGFIGEYFKNKVKQK